MDNASSSGSNRRSSTRLPEKTAEKTEQRKSAAAQARLRALEEAHRADLKRQQKAAEAASLIVQLCGGDETDLQSFVSNNPATISSTRISTSTDNNNSSNNSSSSKNRTQSAELSSKSTKPASSLKSASVSTSVSPALLSSRPSTTPAKSTKTSHLVASNSSIISNNNNDDSNNDNNNNSNTVDDNEVNDEAEWQVKLKNARYDLDTEPEITFRSHQPDSFISFANKINQITSASTPVNGTNDVSEDDAVGGSSSSSSNNRRSQRQLGSSNTTTVGSGSGNSGGSNPVLKNKLLSNLVKLASSGGNNSNTRNRSGTNKEAALQTGTSENLALYYSWKWLDTSQQRQRQQQQQQQQQQQKQSQQQKQPQQPQQSVSIPSKRSINEEENQTASNKRRRTRGGGGRRRGDDDGEVDVDENSKNKDECEACGGTGNLVCCDSCPLSFHIECCDPPLQPEDLNIDTISNNDNNNTNDTNNTNKEDKEYGDKIRDCHIPQYSTIELDKGLQPDGGWQCKKCRRQELDPPELEYDKQCLRDNPFQSLLHQIWFENPSTFSLPPDVYNVFANIEMGPNGEYTDTSLLKPASAASSKNTILAQANNAATYYIPPPVPRDYYAHVSNNSGQSAKSRSKDAFIICYKCRRPPYLPHPSGLMISCDYCNLYWHVDCVSPPMTVPPSTAATELTVVTRTAHQQTPSASSSSSSAAIQSKSSNTEDAAQQQQQQQQPAVKKIFVPAVRKWMCPAHADHIINDIKHAQHVLGLPEWPTIRKLKQSATASSQHDVDSATNRTLDLTRVSLSQLVAPFMPLDIANNQSLNCNNSAAGSNLIIPEDDWDDWDGEDGNMWADVRGEMVTSVRLPESMIIEEFCAMRHRRVEQRRRQQKHYHHRRYQQQQHHRHQQQQQQQLPLQTVHQATTLVDEQEIWLDSVARFKEQSAEYLKAQRCLKSTSGSVSSSHSSSQQIQHILDAAEVPQSTQINSITVNENGDGNGSASHPSENDDNSWMQDPNWLRKLKAMHELASIKGYEATLEFLNS
ncbi:hypothetical protein GQ42DRAFT_50533 [Ramicandelaber brevisporus]|nr:hypothetical protein GQ42DRAFT_50533 [Ramicandelaber brevisporus]